MSGFTMLFLQSFLIFLQMANAWINTLEQPWPIVVAAFIGALQFFLQHAGNMSAPKSRSGGLTGAKGVVVICLLLAGASQARAEETERGVTLGLAYSQIGQPQILGWGTYDQKLAGNLYSYSGYDVLPLLAEDTKMPRLKFTAFTGLAYRFAVINKLHLFVQGAGGMASTADVTTGSGNFGGFALLPIGKGWSLILGGQGSYSPIAGTDALLRFGIRYGVK